MKREVVKSSKQRGRKKDCRTLSAVVKDKNTKRSGVRKLLGNLNYLIKHRELF